MNSEEAAQLASISASVSARYQGRREPQRIADVMAGLMARKGYGRIEGTEQTRLAWATAAGEKLSAQTRPGNVRRGVLEIFVRNSTALQELNFQRKQILQRFQKLLPELKVRDLRLRIGAID